MRLLMKWKPVLFLLFVVAAAMAMPVMVLAGQAPPPPTNVAPEVSSFVLGVIAAAVPLVAWGATWLAGKLVPSIPGFLKPILATAFGFVQVWLPTIPLHGPWAWLLFAALGLAATGLDQIIRKLREARAAALRA